MNYRLMEILPRSTHCSVNDLFENSRRNSNTVPIHVKGEELGFKVQSCCIFPNNTCHTFQIMFNIQHRASITQLLCS